MHDGVFFCKSSAVCVFYCMVVCSAVLVCSVVFWCVLLFVGVWWCVLLYFGMFCCVCVGMFYVWLCVDVFCCLCILLCVGVFCCVGVWWCILLCVDVFCYILVCWCVSLCIGVFCCLLVCCDVFFCVCVNTNFHFLHSYVFPKTLEILSHCRVNIRVCRVACFKSLISLISLFVVIFNLDYAYSCSCIFSLYPIRNSYLKSDRRCQVNYWLVLQK